MISQLYVSRSLIAPADRTRMIDDIVAVAIARNTMLGVTGLLIASPNYFAQLLEGPVPGVAAVMASIAADPRHEAVRVLSETTIEQAICPHWRMAQFEAHNFGGTVIEPVLMAAHAGTDANAIHRLERLIEAMCRDSR